MRQDRDVLVDNALGLALSKAVGPCWGSESRGRKSESGSSNDGELHLDVCSGDVFVGGESE